MLSPSRLATVLPFGDQAAHSSCMYLAILREFATIPNQPSILFAFAASIAVGVSVSTSVSDGRHDQSLPRAKPVMFWGFVAEQMALKLLLAA
jgi:hypothetical protein